MPELPEVETVKCAIADAALKHRIASVITSGQKMRWEIPRNIAEEITDGVITALRRRGKYILMDIQKGSDQKTMIVHLGMSGSVRIYPDEKYDRKKHDHLIMTTVGINNRVTMVLNDPRRFGGVQLIRTEEAESHPLLKKMGVEPLGNEMNAIMMASAFKEKSTPIKSALLDQHIIAGIGNIYASEALYRAGISPKRLAKNVSLKKLEQLASSIKDVLNDAIAQGGTSLRDHVQPGGEIGYFVQMLDVYGRAGEPCKSCGAGIKEIRQTGRSSFYCSHCQR